MLGRLLGAVVPSEVVVAVGEIYVLLVEDGGPLEGGACRPLKSVKDEQKVLRRNGNGTPTRGRHRAGDEGC